MTFSISCPAFADQGMIPPVYTCDGSDVSPPLEWSEPPEGTRSLALVSDDPDAPGMTWVHWVLFNIPADARKLEENAPKTGNLENGSRQGVTDFGRVGYGGPCPPSGTHRYYFKIYALDTVLTLSAGIKKEDLLKAMKGHVLSEAQLMGKYARKR